MSTPRVSVVIPTVGNVVMLNRLLMSLKDYGYIDNGSIEIIVVDNSQSSDR